jgi:hypothetical protein
MNKRNSSVWSLRVERLHTENVQFLNFLQLG